MASFTAYTQPRAIRKTYLNAPRNGACQASIWCKTDYAKQRVRMYVHTAYAPVTVRTVYTLHALPTRV